MAEVLRPQELLTPSLHTGTLAMKRNQQGKPSPKHDKKRSNGRKSIHGGGDPNRHRKGEVGLTMGQVTLLKRGQSIASVIPPQKIVPKPPPSDMFAGSCISPPSPRALPLPTFFNKAAVEAVDSVEDGATMFLRRVLRLE